MLDLNRPDLLASIQIRATVENHIRNSIDLFFGTLLTIDETNAVSCMVDTRQFARQQPSTRLVKISTMQAFPGIGAVCNVITVLSPYHYF